MVQVVCEISVNLVIIEQVLDVFFCNLVQKEGLVVLCKLFDQVVGVFVVLGQESVVVLLYECDFKIKIFGLVVDLCQEDFEEVVSKFLVFGFFVEQLCYGLVNFDVIFNFKSVFVEEEIIEVNFDINKWLIQILIGVLCEKFEDSDICDEFKQQFEMLCEDV